MAAKKRVGRVIVTGEPLKVSEWEFKDDQTDGIPVEEFGFAAMKSRNSKMEFFVNMKWNYAVHKNGIQIIKYTAEDIYSVSDIQAVSFEEFKKWLWNSFWRVNLEYQKRMKEHGVQTTIFFDCDPENLQKALAYLQE